MFALSNSSARDVVAMLWTAGGESAPAAASAASNATVVGRGGSARVVPAVDRTRPHIAAAGFNTRLAWAADHPLLLVAGGHAVTAATMVWDARVGRMAFAGRAGKFADGGAAPGDAYDYAAPVQTGSFASRSASAATEEGASQTAPSIGHAAAADGALAGGGNGGDAVHIADEGAAGGAGAAPEPEWATVLLWTLAAAWVAAALLTLLGLAAARRAPQRRARTRPALSTHTAL